MEYGIYAHNFHCSYQSADEKGALAKSCYLNRSFDQLLVGNFKILTLEAKRATSTGSPPFCVVAFLVALGSDRHFAARFSYTSVNDFALVDVDAAMQ